VVQLGGRAAGAVPGVLIVASKAEIKLVAEVLKIAIADTLLPRVSIEVAQ
jgi:hypothetical protein